MNNRVAAGSPAGSVEERCAAQVPTNDIEFPGCRFPPKKYSHTHARRKKSDMREETEKGVAEDKPSGT